MNRRHFISYLAGTVGALWFLNSCKNKATVSYKTSWLSDNGAFGHMIRDPHFPQPSSEIRIPVLIAGGGVSGLSAARELVKNNRNDFLMLELNHITGGNAISGQNEISAFPWAAHYLPFPNNSNTELLNFLKEENIITSFDAQGLPVYNETYICHEPAERLYLHHKWQDGLVPEYALDTNDKKDIDGFFRDMDNYRRMKGSDGKYVFEIPLAAASTDDFTELDSKTMTVYLHEKGYKSPYLHWYVDYCCRDDYGSPAHMTSAFAGIHYFASRRGQSASAERNSVLTWPEGNHFLVKKMEKYVAGKVMHNQLVYSITKKGNGIVCEAYHVVNKTTTRFICDQLLFCLPYNTAKYILEPSIYKVPETPPVHNWPWAVANIRLKAFEQERGQPLSWDNVIYSENALGYINNCHQLIRQHDPYYNFTFYKNILGATATEARRKAREMTKEQLIGDILQELQLAHPRITESIEEIVVKVWGHGMVSPYPSYLSRVKPTLIKSIDDRIYFAHTDLSGISIFEEAFYQGRNAAEMLLKQKSDSVV